MTSVNFRVFGPAFLAIIVDSMGYGLVYPLMTELFAGDQGMHLAEGMSLALRHFYLGLSFLLFPLGAFFGASFMGDLSDIYGRKKVLLLCTAGLTLSFFLMGVGVEFITISLLLIGRVLAGFMAGSQPIAQAAIIDKSTPATKPRNLAIMTIVLSVGIVIGPLIGGIFSDSSLLPVFTLETPFYIAAGLALITTIWVWTAFPETRVNAQGGKKLYWMRPVHIFYEGFLNKKIRLLALVFMCMQIGFSLFYQLIQVFVAVVYGFASWEIGVFNGYIGIAFGIVVLGGVKYLLKWMEVEKVAALGLLLTAIFLILPMIFPNQVFVWIMVFLAAGFDMLAYGAMMACFSNAAGPEDQGWAMGVFGSIVAATWALTGFSTNLISIIGLRWLISIGGIFMLLSFFLMTIYIKSHPRHLS